MPNYSTHVCSAVLYYTTCGRLNFIIYICIEIADGLFPRFLLPPHIVLTVL